MKFIAIAGSLLLAGCGSYPTLDQLEAEALATGDWSAVERREAVLERRKQRRGPQCPTGFVSYCEYRIGKSSCTCIDDDALGAVLSWN